MILMKTKWLKFNNEQKKFEFSGKKNLFLHSLHQIEMEQVICSLFFFVLSLTNLFFSFLCSTEIVESKLFK